jgi:hypothetical protein
MVLKGGGDASELLEGLLKSVPVEL